VGLARAAPDPVGRARIRADRRAVALWPVRAVFCEQMTFGHLAEAIHTVLVGLGGPSRMWGTDRMATIVFAGTAGLVGSRRLRGFCQGS
jgi:hypothetical protein